MNDTVVVIMAKAPQAGMTKTRLSPPLTPEQAARLYEALLRDTIAGLAALDWADLALAISPPASRAYFEQITPHGTRLLPIEGVDIGDCLRQAFESLFEAGYRKVLALNADGPSLPRAYLQQAAALLDEQDVVLGEGQDGGYYLVGLKALHVGLFQGIAWSTPQVLAQTLQQAARAGLSAALNPPWYDVDTIQDLLRLKAELLGLPADRLGHTRQFLAEVDIP